MSRHRAWRIQVHTWFFFHKTHLKTSVPQTPTPHRGAVHLPRPLLPAQISQARAADETPPVLIDTCHRVCRFRRQQRGCSSLRQTVTRRGARRPAVPSPIWRQSPALHLQRRPDNVSHNQPQLLTTKQYRTLSASDCNSFRNLFNPTPLFSDFQLRFYHIAVPISHRQCHVLRHAQKI